MKLGDFQLFRVLCNSRPSFCRCQPQLRGPSQARGRPCFLRPDAVRPAGSPSDQGEGEGGAGVGCVAANTRHTHRIGIALHLPDPGLLPGIQNINTHEKSKIFFAFMLKLGLHMPHAILAGPTGQCKEPPPNPSTFHEAWAFFRGILDVFHGQERTFLFGKGFCLRNVSVFFFFWCIVFVPA